MEPKRPQLNLTELYQLKWGLGGVLALLSAWTVLYMEVSAWLWLVLITAGVPVVLRWPALTLQVPRWVHRLAFPVIVAVFASDFYFNREPLPAMIRLALMLVFYRAVTPRKRRDDLQLIVLGLFLVVIAGVLSVSLAFAVQIVVFTGCALLFLLVINLIDSAETAQPATTPTAAAPPAWMNVEWLRLLRRLRAATDWRVALLGSGLFAGVVATSTLLFFALPRFDIGNTLFLDNLINRKSKSGFSDTVGIDAVTDIQQDTSVALRVDVSDPAAIPSNPYWRMLVLDGYKNAQFTVSPELKAELEAVRRKQAFVTGGMRPQLGMPVWVFYLEGGTSSYLPLLGGFFSMKFNDGPLGYAISDELRLVNLERTPTKMFAYRVEGMHNEPELGRAEIERARDERPRRSDGKEALAKPTFLKLELGDADVAQLRTWAKELDVTPGDARAFAKVAALWLERGHRYSLQSNIPDGDGDVLVRWMKSKEPGHCELFAGSFTLLARAAGYPTRMVTGFRGGTWNPGSGNLVVRNSDAHAWCEIYDAATDRWVRVDPTPGADLVASVAGSAETAEARLARISDRSWSARLDGLRMLWYRQIVDFDRTAQVELAREAKNAVEGYGKALKELVNERLKAVREWLNRPWDFVRFAAWVFIVAMAFGIVLGWRVWGRGAWMRWRSGRVRSGADPVRKEAGRWLRKLRSRNPDVSREHLADVSAELERLRYGPRQGWPNPQTVFRRAKRVCAAKRRDRGPA